MRRPGSAGFSLIELMICVAIIGFLCEFIPGLFLRMQRLRAIGQRRVEIERAAQTLDGVLGRDVRGAAGLVSKFKDFTASPTCLILEAPRVGAGGRLVSGSPDHVVYHLDRNDAGRLLKEVFPSPGSRRVPAKQVLAANVLSLKILAGARLVNWQMTFGVDAGGRRVSGTFSSAVGLRRGGL